MRNTSTLVSGTVLAQLIPILIQPILRRFFPEAMFGTYAVYLSLIGILYVITSLRYEQAIVLPSKDGEAANILSLAQIINLFFCLLLGIVVWLFNAPLLVFLNIPNEYSIFLYVLPASTFLFNMQQALNLWLIRKKAYTSVSKNKMVRRGVEGSAQLTFRYIGFNGGLLLGDLLGHITNNIYGLWQIIRNGFSFRIINKSKINYVAKKYSEYPRYNTWSTLLNAFSILLPTILINKFYDASSTALFDLSRLVLLTPIAILASSLSNVMLQRIAEKSRKKTSFFQEIVLVAGIGLLIGLMELCLTYFFGEDFFGLVFGSQWREAGTISKVLVWAYILYFISFSLSSVFLALKEVKLLSIYQTIAFILIVSLIFFKNYTFYAFLQTFVLLSVVNFATFALLFYVILRKYLRSTHA